jgi:hypothetical protein
MKTDKEQSFYLTEKSRRSQINQPKMQANRSLKKHQIITEHFASRLHDYR